MFVKHAKIEKKKIMKKKLLIGVIDQKENRPAMTAASIRNKSYELSRVFE